MNFAMNKAAFTHNFDSSNRLRTQNM